MQSSAPDAQHGCCSPSRSRDDRVDAGQDPATSVLRVAAAAMATAATTPFVTLPGGSFEMGEGGPMAYAADGEYLRAAMVAPFAICATSVTNAEFGSFVDTTGYVTEAESFGWSFVFAGLLPNDFEATAAVVGTPWWRQVFGACWKHPEGRGSALHQRLDHPVVHVSWNDAQSYARWVGARLPTEAEWEFAARAGTTTIFPWGDDLEPGGSHMMNVFQGSFPTANTVADGWLGTCPVTEYPPNSFGLHNMVGNVWEWTSDPFSAVSRDTIVVKGGSYLCHASYCRRYRPAARMANTRDSSAGNVGFRIAR